MKIAKFDKKSALYAGILSSIAIFLPLIFIYFENYKWIESTPLIIPWDKKDPYIELIAGKKFCQDFVYPYSSLARIDIMLRKGDGKYVFSLYETEYAIDARARSNAPLHLFSTPFINSVQNYEYQSFVFPKIEDSNGKKFLFCVEANTNNNGSIGLFQSNINDSIVFQAYSLKPVSFINFFLITGNRISQYKPSLFKMPYLIFWFSFYVFFIWWIFYYLIKMFGRRN